MKAAKLLYLMVFLTSVTVKSQTLNVKSGSLTYQFPALQIGEIVFDDGTSVTIMGKKFAVSDIDEIVFDDTEVKKNHVTVSYEGTSATVCVAGNVAQYVDATVSGAHVSINQTNTADIDEDEITYTLSGTTTDGEFALSGSYKCSVALAGLTLTNPSGAAINITNKKRIQFSAKKDTENTLTDGANGSQKACIYSKGQLQLQGNGTLTVKGNTAHAIKSGDYITIKNITLNITSAVKDGISCNKYFQMKGGSVTIQGVGDDGIQADLESDDEATAETDSHEEENSGNLYIEDGTLTVTIPAAASGGKCLKATGLARIDGGNLTLSAAGKVDTSDSTDPSYTAAIKGTNVTVTGGTVGINVTGAAGRGISADETITTDGGTLTINNSAAPTTISSDVKGAKGLKALNIALNNGTINITMSGNASKAIRCGEGTKTTSSSGGGGGGRPGGGGGWPGPGGGRTTWSDVKGSYTQGNSDGTGPTLTISQTGSASSSSSAKAIKAICAVTVYGGETEITTTKSGAEGLESKTSIDIRGGQHYLKCYDDCMNSAGNIYFNGGTTVCYSTGNDVVDSNAGTNGAITIGNGYVLAYMTKGDPDEAFDCDNNNYIQITGTGIAIGAGGKQSSASGTVSNAKQGYSFPGTVSFKANVYNTLADDSGNNLATFQLPAAINSTCTFITATGMKSGSKYTIKSSSTAPTDATIAWHGLYIGSSATGTTSVASFTAK